MIDKITGYSGFRSYGQLEYPTQKQGKELQLANKVWQSTLKQSQQMSHLKNFHYNKTIYRQKYLQNTAPKDYYPQHVPKGRQSSLNFANNSTTQAYDKAQANRATMVNGVNYQMLKTGTEHWKSNYQHEIGNKSLSKTNGFNNNNNYNSRSQSMGKPNLNKGQFDPNNFNNTNNINGNNQNQTGGINNLGATMNSKLGSNSNGLNQQQGKGLSYKNRAYMNNCKTGVTQYKFSIGATIGYKPTDILNQYSRKQPLINNPLKHGTNQLWTEIPGYQGFKPAQIPFNQLKNKIQQRNSVNKGNPKLNLTQNYHINIPGYSGFKPKYTNLDNQLRTSCLTYK